MRIILIIVFLFSSTGIFAQVSPAFDPNIYLPRIGVPGEIDTIMGSTDGQGLGSFIFNTGARPGEAHGNILIQGLSQNPASFSAVETGAKFNLHKLNIRKQLDLDDKLIIKYGHFHDTKHIDLFAYNTDGDFKIYWADDSGYYSKSRDSRLRSYGGQGGGSYSVASNAYTANLSSDTVEDIIFSMSTTWIDYNKDTSFLLYFKGGEQLFKKIGDALPDSSYDLKLYGLQNFERNCSQGDWRGTGREDLMGADRAGNVFYYHNDPSKNFSLEEFYRALRFDTIFAVRENPHFKGTGVFPWEQILTMKALPKKPNDKSLDLVLSSPTDDWRNDGVWFFRGGSDFGSHRITLDSAAYIIRHPKYFDPTSFDGVYFPAGLTNCGDMTGTGNNVLLVGGGVGFTFLNFFYVTGLALDDKADMYYLIEPKPGIALDTLTADNDNLEDLLIGHYAWRGSGALFLLHGSKRIPVHVNSVEIGKAVEQTPSHILAYPNPCEQHTVLTVDNCSAEHIQVTVVNISGKECLRTEVPAVDGYQEFNVDLSPFPAGEYTINLHSPKTNWSGSVKILKTGVAKAPWSLNLKQAVGR